MSDDATLVTRALSGGREAFAAIVDRYHDYVIETARARVRNFHDGEDIAQAVFMEAYEHIGNLQDPLCLQAWLRSITNHRCIDHLRGRREFQNIDILDSVTSNTPDPLAEYERKERCSNVVSAIDRLNGVLRETARLHYVSGKPIKEIANIQDIPLGTVKRRLHEARQALRPELFHLTDGASNRRYEMVDTPEDELTGVEGILHQETEGWGFLRQHIDSTSAPEDIYIAPSQIKLMGLKQGDPLRVRARQPRKDETFRAAVHFDSIQGVELIEMKGVFHIDSHGWGFVRPAADAPDGPEDIYVTPSQIRALRLKHGDAIGVRARPPRHDESYRAAVQFLD